MSSLAAETQQKRALVMRHLVGLNHDNVVAANVAQCTQDVAVATWVCAALLQHCDLGAGLDAAKKPTRLTVPLVAGLTVAVNMAVPPAAARAVAVHIATLRQAQIDSEVYNRARANLVMELVKTPVANPSMELQRRLARPPSRSLSSATSSAPAGALSIFGELAVALKARRLTLGIASLTKTSTTSWQTFIQRIREWTPKICRT